MANDRWDTYKMAKDSQVFWLPRVTEKFLRATREVGLPSEATTGKLYIGLPTMLRQARIQRGDNIPRASDASTPGILKFV